MGVFQQIANPTPTPTVGATGGIFNQIATQQKPVLPVSQTPLADHIPSVPYSSVKQTNPFSVVGSAILNIPHELGAAAENTANVLPSLYKTVTDPNVIAHPIAAAGGFLQGAYDALGRPIVNGLATAGNTGLGAIASGIKSATGVDIGNQTSKTALANAIPNAIGAVQSLQKGLVENPVATAGMTAEGVRVARGLPKGTDAISSMAKPVIDTTKIVAGKVADIAAPTIDATKSAIQPVIDTAKAKAVDSLEQTYKDIQSGTTLGKKTIGKIETKTANLDNAGTTGRTPMRTLAEDGVIPAHDGTKISTFEQANQYRDTIAPLVEANKSALKETGLGTAPLKIDDLESRAIEYARTPTNINAGRFDSMAADIHKEFTLLKTHYPSGEIPLAIVDDIKSARWDNVFKNKGLVEADVLKKNSEYSIAKSLQKSIEDTANASGNTQVAQLNREIGDRLDAANFLQGLDGKTINGGRLLKYVTTGIGASVGHTVIGKIVGALGGNVIGDMIISNTISNPIKRILLSNLETSDPAAYTATIEWLKTQNLDRETRLLLPEGTPRPTVTPAPADTSGIDKLGTQKMNEYYANQARNNTLRLPEGKTPVTNQGRPIISFPKGQKEYVGAETTTGNYQAKSPTSQQTIPAMTKESNIPTTLPPNTPKVKAVIPKSMEPLALEAQKYKSAEEFVKAQGTPILHGTNNKFDVFDASKMGTFEQGHSAKNAFWFSDSKTTAGSYGTNLKEVYAKFDNPIKIDAKGQMYGDMRDVIDEAVLKAKKNGNDAVIVKNLSDRKDWGNYDPATHFGVLDTSKLMTKSQLTDFYNKVTGKKLPPNKK